MKALLAALALQMIVGNGQSLSLGHGSFPVVTKAPLPDNRMMFSSGTRAGLIDDGKPQPLSTTSVLGFTTLKESVQEDMDAGFAMALPDADNTLFVELGVSAQPYVALRAGTQPFANMLLAVTEANVQSNHNLHVEALTIVHGEADEQLRASAHQYEADLMEWYTDFCAAVKEITSQKDCPLLMTDQMSSWTRLSGHPTTSHVTYGQLQAYLDHPDKILLVGPKYNLQYIAYDGVHLTAPSERLLGAEYGRALHFRKAYGIDLVVYPTKATLAGNVISVAFHSASNLVIDRNWISDPNGQAGFRYDDDSHSATITNVTVDPSGKAVQLTLSNIPTGTHPRIGYADVGVSGAHAGFRTGPRGCLRDSSGMPDWCVHFTNMPVN